MQPTVRVDKYQIITFNNNRYSFPGAYAFSPATVKGYVDRVVVIADGQAVASHPQCYGHCSLVLNLLHYTG
jgi:hypothetical protein